ncbi:MFS transporter [Microbispora hainanensis]|uniref:MFS transporter n=1 Tax=Microbispora hainanensis TaxID=568844 RepID=A0ABZ1T267_9ACTN|nr:MFS transporter [Microbispora hainanensis]
MPTPTTDTRSTRPARHRPGLVLTALLFCQLMLVLDVTVVNIALPQIHDTLGFTSEGLAWVLNAYTVTFGGLLLLGGRAGDIVGRRRVFVTGVALFGVASLVGGLAPAPGWLLGARAVQGLGAALASPSALALISTNFAGGPERTRALGLWGAVSGSAATLGLIVGGVLTHVASWRWVLFINVPITVAVLVLTPLFVREAERSPGRFDLPGALTSTTGMGALAFGLINAASAGWGDRVTSIAIGVAVVSLALFALAESRAPQPITPLHLLRDPLRLRSYAAMLVVGASMGGMFYFLTQFLQEVLGFGPLQAGLAFLPVSLVLVVSAQRTAALLPKTGPAIPTAIGALAVTAGLLWLGRLDETSGYFPGVAVPLVLFGIGAGLIYVPSTVGATARVAATESGAASGMLNTTSQLGTALGLAALVTVAGTAARHAAAHPVAGLSAQAQAQHAATYGFTRAFLAAAMLGVVLLVISLIGGFRPVRPTDRAY